MISAYLQPRSKEVSFLGVCQLKLLYHRPRLFGPFTDTVSLNNL